MRSDLHSSCPPPPNPFECPLASAFQSHASVDMDTLGPSGLMSPLDSNSWSSISTPSPLSPFQGAIESPLPNLVPISPQITNHSLEHRERSLVTKHRITSMLNNRKTLSSASSVPPVSARPPSPTGVEHNQSHSHLHASTKAEDKLCKVCGAAAIGRNFGVFTCGSCKIFFRRNVSHYGQLRCRNNGLCMVNKQNRRSCSSCRLQKCLNKGMKVKSAGRRKDRNSDSTSSTENHLDSGWQQSARIAHRGSLEDEQDESNDTFDATVEENGEKQDGVVLLDQDIPELVPIQNANAEQEVDAPIDASVDILQPECSHVQIEEPVPMEMSESSSLEPSCRTISCYQFPSILDLDENDCPERNVHRLKLIERFNRKYLELAKKPYLIDSVHTQVRELNRLTPHIRLRFGLPFFPQDNQTSLHLLPKEHFLIDTLNRECSSITANLHEWSSRPVKVFNSLERGIYYADQSFKMFEKFWSENGEFSAMIRQDETTFNKKKNILLHQMYHLRGVHFFDQRENAWAITQEDNNNNSNVTLIKVDMFQQSVKKEMSAKHLRYINSFPKEWRFDSTIFNLTTYLLMYSRFEYLHANFKSEKIRFYAYLYMLRRYFDELYQDEQKSLQMVDWIMRQITDELASLCRECLTACTHSLNLQLLEKIGPSYAACLMLEQEENKHQLEANKRTSRHDYCLFNGHHGHRNLHAQHNSNYNHHQHHANAGNVQAQLGTENSL